MLLNLLLALLLSACSAMPDIRVANFPKLETVVKVVEPGDIYQICAPMLGGYLKGILYLPMACANVNLYTGKCTIYVTETSPPETVEHEKLHCLGYWHDDGLQLYYDEWKRGRPD